MSEKDSIKSNELQICDLEMIGNCFFEGSREMIEVEEVQHNLIEIKRYKYKRYIFHIFLDQERFSLKAFMSKANYFNSMITCGFTYPLSAWKMEEALDKILQTIKENGEDYIHRYEEQDKMRGIFGSPYNL